MQLKECLVVSVGIMLRWLVSIHSYSGENHPPHYGDFEAHRHWMEITTNLPLTQWYSAAPLNNLTYWGLDYPPLSAYSSLVFGSLGKRLDPQWFALQTSAGFESPELKLFMRLTVLVADLLVLFPPILLFLGDRESPIDALVVLCSPALVLIDHGHFQYNGAMLGLTALAICLAAKGRFAWAALFFVWSFCFKQMALYYALPFFFFLLGKCFENKSLFLFLKLVLVVSVGLAVPFAPFLSSADSISDVIGRLFPLQRGLFEGKVANFWCASTVAFKIRDFLTHAELFQISAIATLAAFIPSGIHLLVRPSMRNFLCSLACSSLAFFLFSYQVHEKSILLPLFPISLLFASLPSFSSLFALHALFSLHPLLKTDKLQIPYLAMMMVAFSVALGPFSTLKPAPKFAVTVQVLLMSAYHFYDLAIPPPPRYPDLYVVANCVYNAAFFGMSLLFLLYWQIYGKEASVEKEKRE